MAKSGKYQKIFINRGLKSITGRDIKGINRKPDIAGVLKGSGKIDMVEIPHPGQTQLQMQQKITTMEGQIGKLAGPGSYATPPVP